MTGVTFQLAPWQADELRAYADGLPQRTSRRPDNLIRRGLLERVGAHGQAAYRITALGIAALQQHDEETVT